MFLILNIKKGHNMLITSVTLPAFQGYIPLSEYKGPILKLTKKDKELIAHYIHEKSLIELEIVKLRSVYDSYKIHNIDSEWYADKMGSLVLQRDNIDKLIQEVKTNRINQQKLAASKKK